MKKLRNCKDGAAIGVCCDFPEELDSMKKEVLETLSVQGRNGNVCSTDVNRISGTEKAMTINLTRKRYKTNESFEVRIDRLCLYSDNRDHVRRMGPDMTVNNPNQLYLYYITYSLFSKFRKLEYNILIRLIFRQNGTIPTHLRWEV